MHYRVKITISIALIFFGLRSAQAQERVPLPPPDPSQGGAPEYPNAPNVPPPLPDSAPPPGVPQNPYAPPPGVYPPPYPTYPPPPVYPPVVTYVRPADDPCFWIGAEALIWWVKEQPLSVPVLTTGAGSEGANAGALGAPGTQSLTQPLDMGATGGVRLFAGGWFDQAHTIGMDGSLFILGQQTHGFGANDPSGTGQFVINEPVAGVPFITQVSAPGLETGSASVNARTQFGGGDINLLYNLQRGNGWSINLLGGFRYLQLHESLNINASSNVFVTTNFIDNFGNIIVSAPPGSTIAMGDFFGTRNQFYGGQIGAQGQYWMGRWYLNATGKLAIGGTYEVINVNGVTNVSPVGGSPVSLSGGNFATNQQGHYAFSKFAFAPELQLKLGYQVTPWMRGVVGYDFVYLSSVARPGNQIDNLFDGISHPLVPMASSSFWAQGLSLGLHFSY
jgi:hypothetical protein